MELKIKSAIPVKCKCGYKAIRVTHADAETTQVYLTDKKGNAIKKCPKCKKKLTA